MAKASVIRHMKVVLELTEEEAEYLRSLLQKSIVEGMHLNTCFGDSGFNNSIRSAIFTELNDILDDD